LDLAEFKLKENQLKQINNILTQNIKDHSPEVLYFFKTGSSINKTYFRRRLHEQKDHLAGTIALKVSKWGTSICLEESQKDRWGVY
jgi:hypothetical protein